MLPHVNGKPAAAFTATSAAAVDTNYTAAAAAIAIIDMIPLQGTCALSSWWSAGDTHTGAGTVF